MQTQTHYAEMVTQISEVVQLCQCSTAKRGELGVVPWSYNFAASASELHQFFLYCLKQIQGTADASVCLIFAVMETCCMSHFTQ